MALVLVASILALVLQSIAETDKTQKELISYFPERPDNFPPERWSGLRAAVEEAKLLPSPEGIGGQRSGLGGSISISGDRVLIGGTGINDSAGAVVVLEYRSGMWIEEAMLLPSDSRFGHNFGRSVSLSGDRALIGADGDDVNGDYSGSAYVFEFNGSSWVETAKLMPADGSGDDFFGNTVSLVGDRALISAYGDSENGYRSGSVYIFEFDGSTWSETNKLLPADGEAYDLFGRSLSQDGNRILIGAPGEDENGVASGAAYIFELSGMSWIEVAKLLPAEGQEGDFFGGSVSLSSSHALIGAMDESVNGSGYGAAYIFEFNGVNWDQIAKLQGGDTVRNDYFGHSVSLSGDYALVGASRDDDNGYSSGSAYLFKFNGNSWNATAKLVPADNAANDVFGVALSFSDNRILIGAPGDDDMAPSAGAVYVFDFNGSAWTESDKLVPAPGAAFDEFGFSVSLSGNRALIGSHLDDDNGFGSGSAYVFDFNGTSWIKTAKLIPADGAEMDLFGSSVSVDGDRALIGARLDDGIFPNSGSTYIFDLIGDTWTETAKLLPVVELFNGEFGRAVSLSGDRALIGVESDSNINGSSAGAAYVFDFDGIKWTETTKLLPVDGEENDRFGFSVSLEGDRALIGSYLDDDGGSSSGSAYVFDFDGVTWVQTDKLLPRDGSESHRFGNSVSLSGDRALIGAYRDDHNGPNSGSAYLFDYDGAIWVERAKLVPDDAGSFDEVGWTVSLSGNRALIGTYTDGDYGRNTGTAYLFELTGSNWIETAKLLPTDGDAFDEFGYSISLFDDHALIGARKHSGHGASSGSTYVFDLGIVFRDDFENVFQSPAMDAID